MNCSGSLYKIDNFGINIPKSLVNLSLDFSNNLIFEVSKFTQNLINVKKTLKSLKININNTNFNKKSEFQKFIKAIGTSENLEELQLKMRSNFLNEDSIRILKNGINLLIKLKNS